MTKLKTATFALSLLACLSAWGQEPARDARGWLPGHPAANTQAVLTPLPDSKAPTIELPKLLMDKVQGKTVVFYFSPTCPHCKAVAAEVNQLSLSLEHSGAKLIGVASGSASADDLKAFMADYKIRFQVVRDADHEIVAAIGARSTPSVLLVEPVNGKKVRVRDAWYPYVAGFDTLVMGRITGDLFSGFKPNEYQGNSVCGTCHVYEQLSWGLTHHSVAWATLFKRDRTSDPKCTGCHVTGAGQPTGWTPTGHALTDVGCESCHGPGGPHDGQTSDARAACVQCHDEDHSINFSVEKGLPLIDHFRAESTSNEDFEKIRKQLFDGQAPRPLLAFEQGPNVGPQACQSCHPAESAQWTMSPHSGAMAQLNEEQAKDAACVRCHATATHSGPPPADVADFYTATGVSCESCHGPGQAHVAGGGGAGNIEGLGDDCPTCVIEAVCTGCHTTKWDPKWDLDTKLPLVGHGQATHP